MPEPTTSQLSSIRIIGLVALSLSVLSLLAALGWGWQGYERMRQLEIQLARRIGEFDAASQEARVAAKAANEALADLNHRLLTLETSSQETQSQQLALTAMYQDLARSQDERVVADIEQTLLLAQQQLQLAGNVRAALIGLDAAETRLVQLNKPQFASLRAAIVKDMERLKLLPAADIDGLNARLEVLVQNVDALNLESDAESVPYRAEPQRVGSVGALARWSRDTWSEFKSLVRIRRIDNPDLPLLTPSQTYFLRENLKLRLLTAKLALLQRDEVSFRSNLTAAKEWSGRFFSQRDETSKAFKVSLDEMLHVPVALKGSRIDVSLEAARAARKGH